MTLQKKLLFFCLLSCLGFNLFAQSIPQYEHVLIAVLENHGYSQMVGASSAPYINSLIADPNAATFTDAHGISHPSQPNYLQLFSGSNQGVTDDNLPPNLPFTTCNLGSELLTHGYTFAGYSEDLPSVGSNVETNANYARKHNPWVNWQDASVNGIPASLNLPYTDFPADYSTLPTLSFVIPNLANDMHDPPFLPTAISTGDAWVHDNLDSYVQWAKTHSSLFILTFDEDEYLENQRILTIFIGQHVMGGQYNQNIDHYSVLRTLEDMYGLNLCQSSQTATPITNCWTASAIGIEKIIKNPEKISITPNPVKGIFTLSCDDISLVSKLTITNSLGQLIQADYEIVSKNTLQVSTQNLPGGLYTLELSTKKGVQHSRFIAE